MRKLFALLSLLFLSSQSRSQKQLSIRPYIGLQNGFWYNYTKPEKIGTRANFIELDADIGISLEYQKNKRFGYNLGVYANIAANGHAFLLKTGCPQVGFEKSWSGAAYTRFGLGIDYILSKKVLKPDFSLKKTSIVIAISAGIGINKRANEDLNSGFLTSFSSQDTCGNYAVATNHFDYNIKEWTASVWVRPWIKFFFKGKERIAFSLIFNQGLINCYSEEITYDYNGSLYKFINKTRGTTLGFNLSYPILIKSWRKK